MFLTPDQKEIGKQNYADALETAGVTRRSFLKGGAAVAAGAGAFYFNYQKLTGAPVKTGFIGTGDEGCVLITHHPPEYMDIVAIADLRPSNQKRAFDGDGIEDRVGLIKKLGRDTASKIKVYNTHKELLADPEIEAVVVATPLNTHYQIVIDCLKAGKHVLCEKLMAHNVAQCKEMIREARAARRLLSIGHQRHYSVLYDNANDLVRQGLLGDIKFIRASWHRNNSWPGQDSWNKKVPELDRSAEPMLKEFGFDSLEQLCRWRLYRKTGGGLMAELGSHQLDACSIFLGKRKPLAVIGYGGRNFYGVKGVGSKDKQLDPREIDDHVYVTLEFPGPHYQDDPNDIVIVTYSSINTNRMEPYGETIFGSRGTMFVEQEQNVMLWKEPGGDTGGGGAAQRLKVVASGGGPVMEAYASLVPSGVPSGPYSSQASTKISRGYTEEMEHFAYCLRTNNFEAPDAGGLRCPGPVALADAVMALTCNIAMQLKKRVVFKPEWFDADNPATPESDPELQA
jgi:predicted dehydrogenase